MDSVEQHWKVMDALRRMNAEMERQLYPFCSLYNVTSLQLCLLIILYNKGPQTINALARKTNMADANNSALCKKLEKEGLVVRERDPDDERQVLVRLSERGTQLVQLFSQDCDCKRRRFAAFMSEEETMAISVGMKTLQAVWERLQQEEEER